MSCFNAVFLQATNLTYLCIEEFFHDNLTARGGASLCPCGFIQKTNDKVIF